MSLKVALVGCGKMADSHAEEIAKLKNGRLVAVCDAELLMAEQLAVRFGIPHHFGNLQQMLETIRPDVLHIVTPPQSHLALAKIGVDAGCHVFVEKPLAMDLADTLQLVDYVRRAGKLMTTGWRANFEPPALLLQRMLEDGMLGEVVHVESVFGYELSGPYGTAILGDPDHWVRKLPGQLFHNNIDHMLNKLPVFFGDEMPHVDAKALCFRGTGSPNDLPDELRIMLTGRRVTAFANFSANAKPTAHSLAVWGTKSTVSLDYVSRSVTFAASPKLPSAIGRLLMPFGQGYQFARAGAGNVVRFLKSEYQFNSGLGLLFERFYDSILASAAPPISDSEMIWVSTVMERTFEQTRASAAEVR